MSLQIITQHTTDGVNARALANDVDAQTLDLEGLERIDLNFPKFTDGRAFSQAFVLRRRGKCSAAVFQVLCCATTKMLPTAKSC
jgi:uncharacterized protein (DUF934 family)